MMEIELKEDPEIRFVNMDGGNLGVPEPGVIFDRAYATTCLPYVVKWAERLLAAIPNCPKDCWPVLPIGIVGSGRDTMVREIGNQLPKGVEVYHEVGNPGKIVSNLLTDGVPSGRTVFYLWAPLPIRT